MMALFYVVMCPLGSHIRQGLFDDDAMTWERFPSVTGRFPSHDDVIKWKHFSRYWPFMRGIHWSPVNSPHKGQWHGTLMFSMIFVWTNGWVNIREVGDLRRNRPHYDVTVMTKGQFELFLVLAWTRYWTNSRYIWRHGVHVTLFVMKSIWYGSWGRWIKVGPTGPTSAQ